MNEKYFLGARHINDLTEIKDAIIIVGIPTERSYLQNRESGHTYRIGTMNGPQAIREASLIYDYPNFEGLYDAERDEYLLTKTNIFDFGDLIDNYYSSEDYDDTITKKVREIIQARCFPVLLGGDHSISYPIIKAFEDDIEVIHLDAHTDCQEYDIPDAIASGSVLRKISELSQVKRIIHVGMRGYLNSSDGIRYTKEKGNVFIPANKFLENGASLIIKNINPKLKHYITFDTDILDPSICPGTTTPEPGGIDFRNARELLIRIAKYTNVVGLDVVELNPKYDIGGLGAFHTAHLVLDFLGAKFE